MKLEKAITIFILATAGLFLIFVVLFFLKYTCPNYSVFPSTKGLSHDCLRAAVNPESEHMCSPKRAKDGRLSGAELRNISFNLICRPGNDDEIELGTLTFEYKLPDNQDWKSGTFDIYTHYQTFPFGNQFLGKRYIEKVYSDIQ